MRKFALLTLLVTALSGCVTTASQYGNFTQNFPAVDAKIADDTVRQLSMLYPAASTRINLQQETTDTFGVALIAALREKGYAVAEFVPLDKKTGMAEIALSQANGMDLRYVLDHLSQDNLYRITIVIGNRSLTRAYVEKNETALAAGAWARKE